MGDFGDSFVNVAEHGRLASTSAAVDRRALLQAIVDALRGRSGATVFFPPGRYLVLPRPGAPPEGPDLEFPENLTLWFCPGAVLAPGAIPSPFVPGEALTRGAVVVVRGALRAGVHPIFATPAPGRVDAPDTGRVVLASDRIAQVLPAWWGADGADAERDTAALQTSLHAAIRDRLRRGLAPLPVRLTGSHGVTRALEVDTRDAPAKGGGFVLEGSAAPSGTGPWRASLVCAAPLPFPGDAMLVVRGPAGFTLRNVSFDGAGHASVCLSLEAADPDRALEAARIEGCAFRGATHRLVHVGAPDLSDGSFVDWLLAGATRSEPLSGVSLALLLGGVLDLAAMRALRQSVSNLVFERCRFLVDRGEGRARALVLRAARDSRVELRDCVVTGRARALIHAWGGVLALVACSLENAQRPADPEHVAGPSGGLDVFLASPHVDPPASLRAIACASRSWQFLGGFRGPLPSTYAARRSERPVRTSVLTGLDHQNVHRGAPGDPDPPAIAWDGPGAGGGTLVATGCLLRRPALRATTTGAPLRAGTFTVGPNASRILDLGTRTDALEDNPFAGDGFLSLRNRVFSLTRDAALLERATALRPFELLAEPVLGLALRIRLPAP